MHWHAHTTGTVGRRIGLDQLDKAVRSKRLANNLQQALILALKDLYTIHPSSKELYATEAKQLRALLGMKLLLVSTFARKFGDQALCIHFDNLPSIFPLQKN
jgi:hypothetical protein